MSLSTVIRCHQCYDIEIRRLNQNEAGDEKATGWFDPLQNRGQTSQYLYKENHRIDKFSIKTRAPNAFEMETPVFLMNHNLFPDFTVAKPKIPINRVIYAFMGIFLFFGM